MASPSVLSELYREIRSKLEGGGIDDSGREARAMIRHVVGVSDIDLIARSDLPVSAAHAGTIGVFLERRMMGEPLTRIFGEKEFRGRPFKVTPDVLDPRPDTETIIDAALRRFIDSSPLSILDLGTGSGCLIVSLLAEWPRATGVGVDVSAKALEVAAENAERHGIEKRLRLVESNWGESVTGTFDLIVSNPPYIANHELANLPVEVRNFDPILALAGGEDGLSCYKIILGQIKNLLSGDGLCLLEVGYSQADDVGRLAEDSGFRVAGVHPDMAGIPRVVEISFGEK